MTAQMDVITIVLGPLQTNCYIVQAGQACFVVDPDGETTGIERAISRLGASTVAVILTHGHVDHALGSGELAERLGVPLMAHPLDAPLLRDVGRDAWIVGAEGGAPVVASESLEHGQKLEVADQSLTVLHTPGHSPGSVCLVGEGFLLSGDLLFRRGVGRTDLPGGSLRELEDSVVHVVFALPPETLVYPGHGPPTTVGEEIEFWRAQGWLRERGDS